MPRAKTNHRAKTAAAIEEINRGIEKLQDQISKVDDLRSEGFPYRDAMRARTELQIRESIRRIFGDKSPEYQLHRNYKLCTGTQDEVAATFSMLQELVGRLERKKLDLQGNGSPGTEMQQSSSPPPLTLVPPAPIPPQVTVTPIAPASHPVTSPPVTMSVSLATNVGMSSIPAPTSMSAVLPPQSSAAAESATILPPVQASSPSPTSTPPSHITAPHSVAPNTITEKETGSAPSQTDRAVDPVTAESKAPIRDSPPAPQDSTVQEAVLAPPPRMRSRANSRPSAALTPEVVASHARVAIKSPNDAGKLRVEAARPTSAVRRSNGDPLEQLRKLCTRFHIVARQLRLRREYRATLEVEDEYDVQDLLYALLRLEFDEIETEDWTPSYADRASRTTFFLHRDGIAVVVKKTRPGLGVRELSEQLQIDAEQYGGRGSCTTLFCFIYDPEGRIGNPRGLEGDLTSISDLFTIEVLVAPK